MKFYAAENTKGFANTWDVLVFDSKASRDAYVEKRDGLNLRGNIVDCRVIKKSEATGYATNESLSGNGLVAPKPFTGQCWIISKIRTCEDDIHGYIGDVVVGYPDDGERLF